MRLPHVAPVLVNEAINNLIHYKCHLMSEHAVYLMDCNGMSRRCVSPVHALRYRCCIYHDITNVGICFLHLFSLSQCHLLLYKPAFTTTWRWMIPLFMTVLPLEYEVAMSLSMWFIGRDSRYICFSHSVVSTLSSCCCEDTHIHTRTSFTPFFYHIILFLVLSDILTIIYVYTYNQQSLFSFLCICNRTNWACVCLMLFSSWTISVCHFLCNAGNKIPVFLGLTSCLQHRSDPFSAEQHSQCNTANLLLQ